MVKVEKPSSDEESGVVNKMQDRLKALMTRKTRNSGSESDVPQTPLAASTQKSPPPRKYESDEESEDYQPASQEGGTIPSPSLVPKTVENTKEKYLNKFPNVRPSKPKYSVDVDLTDPDDEVWIVRCPRTIDAKAALLNAKLDTCQFGEAAPIRSSSQKLEGLVTKNATKKPVIIMSGAEFKSFVPVGTIQIRDALVMDPIPTSLVKQEGRGLVDEDDSIPFPEVIRDRHPMLGLNYKAALKLPKKVKKALSLARQRDEASYLESGLGVQADTAADVKPKRKRKRTEGESDLACSSDELIHMVIKKEEEQNVSPMKKKQKKTKTKQEPAVEDDLSWLHNI